MFRTEIALREYECARLDTLAFLAASSPGRPAWRRYFEAVSRWEVVVLNVQIALDLYWNVINPSDEAVAREDPIHKLGNRIKHFGEDIRQGKNSADLTIPIWLTANALLARTAEVTFEHLADSLREMAKAADILEQPGHPG
jgi:hypothetical protein